MIAVDGIPINNVILWLRLVYTLVAHSHGYEFNGVTAAVNFFQDGLGMAVVRHTDNWAELICPVGTRDTPRTTMPQDVSEPINFHLSIQACESEAQLGVGYSPFLSLDVDNAFTRQWLDARKWVPILID